ncbi:MAG: 16S rRNA (uracil(1498)-N(3))-methyltransferase, partial [Flavobacteriaceae bacterium]|nr:16S rRNA (uracil(1498)-N(3))-methyltransferase [Flavobacteriaceae bacterium]
MQVGDNLHTTNGRGFLFKVILEVVSPKRCIAKILKVSKEDPLPYQLHLAVAPTKLNDR